MWWFKKYQLYSLIIEHENSSNYKSDIKTKSNYKYTNDNENIANINYNNNKNNCVLYLNFSISIQNVTHIYQNWFSQYFVLFIHNDFQNFDFQLLLHFKMKLIKFL